MEEAMPVTIPWSDPSRPRLSASLLTGMPVGDSPVSPSNATLKLEPLSRHAFLADAFRAVVAARPDHPAVQLGEAIYSYRQLGDAALAVAEHLQHDCEIQQGECVGLLLENGPEYVAAFFGVLLAGGVATPLPPTVEGARLDKIRRSCRLRVFLSDAKTIRKRRDFDASECCEVDLQEQGRSLQPATRDPERSPAMVLFTSGSSGEPKGVMLSDANLLANAASIVEYLAIHGEDRALALLPFYHAFGGSVLQTHLLSGATLVIAGSLTFPETVIEALAEHRATSFSGVPEVFHALLQYSSLGKTPLPQLRYMTVAGGRLDSDAAAEVAEKIAPAGFCIMYGQSEAAPRLAYLPPEELEHRRGSIGRAIPGVELSVRTEDGSPAAVGVLGELCARGPNIMLGYWDAPQETAAVLADGWLHTGDLALVDQQGYFYIKGRKNELVKIQGQRTHPREIEEAITASASSWRVIVTPYPRGDTMRLAMYVAPGPGESITVEQVRRLALRELPRVKVPSYIEILNEVPLNAGLKVDRAELTRRAIAADDDVRKAA